MREEYMKRRKAGSLLLTEWLDHPRTSVNQLLKKFRAKVARLYTETELTEYLYAMGKKLWIRTAQYLATWKNPKTTGENEQDTGSKPCVEH